MCWGQMQSPEDITLGLGVQVQELGFWGLRLPKVCVRAMGLMLRQCDKCNSTSRDMVL